MKVEILDQFRDELESQVRYIARDKASAARKFRIDVLKQIAKIGLRPFAQRHSIYYDDSVHRDLVFKGYKFVYKVDEPKDTIFIIGLVNMQHGISEG